MQDTKLLKFILLLFYAFLLIVVIVIMIGTNIKTSKNRQENERYEIVIDSLEKKLKEAKQKYGY